MQNINLYPPAEIAAPEAFSAVGTALALAVIVVAMGVLSALGGFSASRAEARLAEAEQMREQVVSQLTNIDGVEASPAEQAALREAIARLESERDDRRMALESLERLSINRDGGLAEPLAALSRQHRSQLWLTDVRIGREGLRLKGSTRDEQAVADYLERLSQEPAFRGTRFHGLRIERLEATERGVFGFELSSQVAP